MIEGLVIRTASSTEAVKFADDIVPKLVIVAPSKFIVDVPVTNFCPLRSILLLYIKVFAIDVSANDGDATSIAVPPKICV